MTPDPIEWTGDLDDDCTAYWHGMVARAECMSRPDKKHPNDPEYWWCAVYDGNEEVFGSNGDDFNPKTGPAARYLCELFMRERVARAKLAAIEERDKALSDEFAKSDGLNTEIVKTLLQLYAKDRP